MLNFIAKFFTALAHQGAGAASLGLSYQPKTPVSLINK